jgi:hypothetical protein
VITAPASDRRSSVRLSSTAGFYYSLSVTRS